MSITLELPKEVEEVLQLEAARQGVDPQEIVSELILRELPSHVPTARELLAMPVEEPLPYLMAAARAAAPLYEADLALPLSERELTAFTALDADPFYEYDG